MWMRGVPSPPVTSFSATRLAMLASSAKSSSVATKRMAPIFSQLLFVPGSPSGVVPSLATSTSQYVPVCFTQSRNLSSHTGAKESSQGPRKRTTAPVSPFRPRLLAIMDRVFDAVYAVPLYVPVTSTLTMPEDRLSPWSKSRLSVHSSLTPGTTVWVVFP